MKHINIPHEINKIDIADIHTAFKKLKLDIAPAKPGSNKMDLRVNGRLMSETVTRLNVELEHIFYAGSKTRTAKIHGMLDRLGLKVRSP